MKYEILSLAKIPDLKIYLATLSGPKHFKGYRLTAGGRRWEMIVIDPQNINSQIDQLRTDGYIFCQLLRGVDDSEAKRLIKKKMNEILKEQAISELKKEGKIK